MDEEAQKRNTDCVYFLASPLTCKKGDSCEFRHSEAARLNPRDCWYWIHRTCLNPNCSFRHPPLEGKPASSQPQQALVAPASTAVVAAPASTAVVATASKSKTPCYFFSQGHCAKGDKCPFMHGPPVPSSTDATSQKKPSTQPPHGGEPEQASSKPVVVLKGNNADVRKQTSHENFERRSMGKNEGSPLPLKAIAHVMQEVPQIAKDLERAGIPESSATSNPSRLEKVVGSRKLRIGKFSDMPQDYQESVERFHDMQSPVERSRKDQPVRKQQQQQQSQHVSEHLRSRQVADHRYQNGSRSDVWWKNESSILEGDGSDQSNQREDGEYSPQFESRGRTKGLDDSTGSVFKSPNSFGQAEPESVLHHRQPSYKKHREQQMHRLSDYNGSIEHPRHRSFSSNTRTRVRDGQRMVSEGYVTNVDLRDQLMKRRRDDRGHYQRIARRGHADLVDIPHLNQRLCDDNLIQHDQQVRGTYRGVADYRGVKRPRRDGGMSPDGFSLRTSPIRHHGPGKSPEKASPNRHSVTDYSKGEMKDRGRERYPTKVAAFSDARNHPSSKSVRSEFAKDNAGFAGPKTLAQIKAEKMAEANSVEGGGYKGKQFEANAKLADARSAMSVKNRDLVVSTSRRLHGDKRGSALDYKSASSKDFEGPKPLSWLLKEKQKGKSGNGAQLDMEGPKKTEDVFDDTSREVEDGEVRDEEDEWNDEQSGHTESPLAPLHEEALPRLPSNRDLGHTEEVHSVEEPDEIHDDMDSSEDVSRLDVDMGPTMSGEEEYELDDDDDEDFAKKLGGFLS